MMQLKEELKHVEAKHQKTGGSVAELTETLSVLSEELDELKEKMDLKGDSVSWLDLVPRLVALSYFGH